MAGPNFFLTTKGVAKIEAELRHLRNNRRPELVERLQDTQAGGDWVDNIEYLTTRDELAFLDGRIHQLDFILRHAQLIQPGIMDGYIHLGNTVVVQENGSPPETFTIVGSTEADPSVGFISDRSPLGRALLAHQVGDEVTVVAPDGIKQFRIVAIT